MKQVKRIALVISVATLISGCGAQLPNLTAEQSKQVAEYAAGLLMKYDENHESRLLSDEELEEELARLQALADRKAELAAYDEALKQKKEEEKAQKDEALANTPVSGQGENVVSGQYVEEFYGIQDFQIRYQGYEVLDSYPQSGEELYFMMQANSGKKLLVLKFTAQNVSGSEQMLDMISLMPQFKISINGGKAQYALSTLLSDDMANYRGIVAAQESIPLVLIAEITEEMSGNISEISVLMQNESKRETILLN